MMKSTPTTEAALERATLTALRGLGALCYKFVSPSRRGVPDDIVLLPNGHTIFIEFKNPKGSGRLSELQKISIDKIRAQGFSVFVVKSLNDASMVYDYCKQRINDYA